LVKKTKMNRLSFRSIVFTIIFTLFGIFFVIDPFDNWPEDSVGRICTPESERARCTGKIIFPWQRP
jgi:hypothetical protein